MESKDGIPLVWLCVCVYIYIYICFDICFLNSSPYLLVFDNDHVCGTWEQMMLQVDLVRHRAEAWASLGNFL